MDLSQLPSSPVLALEAPSPGVLVVRLQRPGAANALDTALGRALGDVWRALADDHDAARADGVRCAVLAAAGDGAFCAGADLKERDGMTDAAWRAQHAVFERMLRAQLECPVPIVAAVRGHAYAGGLELVLACDFAYGARGARFAFTEVRLGIMPGLGGTQLLPRIVGERRAQELILTGRPFDADDAAAWGVLNRVCAPDELMPAVLDTARTIAAHAPLSVRQAKKAMRHGAHLDLATALRFELEAYDALVGTEDRREGIASFREKRAPVFVGR